jgi:hypothetical protein
MRIVIIAIVFVNLIVGTCFGVTTKSILILHSYNKGLAWTDNLNENIVPQLLSDKSFVSDIRIEYLDAKRFESESYFEFFGNFLFSKYKETKFDLIILSDNPAFNFVIKNRNRFKGNPSVVFCGLNYADSIPKRFTGVMEDVDIYSNLLLITKIHPQYHKLYIINDLSITGKVIKKQVAETIKVHFAKLKYEIISDCSFEDLKAKIKNFKPDDVVLLLTFNYDKTGKVISYDKILDEISPICNAQYMVYGIFT